MLIIITLRPTATLVYEQPGVMLSDLSRVSEEAEANDSDHEYEVLDKYSQPYEIPEASPTKQDQQQKSSPAGGDYELTECPAYVPVATSTGIPDSTVLTQEDEYL